MSLRFIGQHDFTSKGKFVWEILSQLRNMGEGRYITNYCWNTKWPLESSYIKIIAARPKMDRWLQQGVLWGEWTFRGIPLGVYKFGNELNRSQWILVHKHEEKKLIENEKKMPKIRLPSSFPIPPLQRLLANKLSKKLEILDKTTHTPQERALLDLCVDPEFEHLSSLFERFEPTKESSQNLNNNSIYNEVDPSNLLELLGQMFPVKIDALSSDKAYYKPLFKQKRN
uniref:Uncharacterized protein n=3 Tax=Meloidogyne TaxID=189290 RepID=A0A6V7TPH2_MELEN|nr:unnamed protein product [Meloidogyne enterolobii]